MTTTSLPPHLDRLGRQLTAAAHERLASPRPSRRPALRLAALGSTGLAAAAAVGVFAISATTATQPAFAVTRHHNGSVSVKINRRSGVAGANRKLAAMGIHDRVMAKGDGSSLQVSCLAPGPGSDGNTLTITGYPTVSTRPASAPGSTTTSKAAGSPSTDAPAVGTTWHEVDCSSIPTNAG